MTKAWFASLALFVAIALPASAQQGTAVKDCAACPELLRVAPGSFTMGEPADGVDAISKVLRADAMPAHRVTIAAFWMGRAPVTRDEFASFVAATGHAAAGCTGFGGDPKVQDKDRDWRNPGFAQAGNHPAVCLSANDAAAYVDWLRKTTGKPYRLPSEAEWEYAARAGTTTARFWGERIEDACGHANVADETLRVELRAAKNADIYLACSDGHAFTAPVASFAANPWGFHDMLGQVWQWTADCWHEDYRDAPADGSAWEAANGGKCGQRVARGGSWISAPWRVHAAQRDWSLRDGRRASTGFRVARDE